MRGCMRVLVRVFAYVGANLQYDEELITGLSLDHNLLSVLELNRLQGVGHRQTLPLVKGF